MCIRNTYMYPKLLQPLSNPETLRSLANYSDSLSVTYCLLIHELSHDLLKKNNPHGDASVYCPEIWAPHFSNTWSFHDIIDIIKEGEIKLEPFRDWLWPHWDRHSQVYKQSPWKEAPCRPRYPCPCWRRRSWAPGREKIACVSQCTSCALPAILTL